ncbi:DUF748 domain-containing protein [Opitutus terrae]|uniref:DUF748 domain-containing protein n=1 Tax=Opitutus terrae (strain DSM 11246 / JCM 15787 / PB90-1) TaxID=452637 RepID=B1ZNB5_OPITP|nr:DUF748 domain-containing protein [Opitutus terrae]ACB73484.1 hypothetical protein Oter_0193 [Opitutus terrae PB90-1]
MKLKSLTRRRHRNLPPEAPDQVLSRPPRRSHGGWWIALGTVLVVLALVRFVGSPIARSVVNQKLAAMPDFVGRVEGVTLAIWRGAVDVDDFVLYERGFEDEPPLLHLRRARMSFSWTALLSGKIGGRLTIDGAEVNAIKRIDDNTSAGGRNEEEREGELKAEAREKKEVVKRWQDELRQALPLELTRFELTGGRIRVADVSKDPAAEFTIEHLHVVVTDLQNRPKANGDSLPTQLKVDGRFAGGGQLHAEAQVDPLAEQPRFTGNFEIRELQLPALNGFLLAYANADVGRGTFEVYAEIQARDGRYEGYVKPLFHDLDFRTASDRDKNAAELLAKKVVSAVAAVLKNDEKDQVATKAPFAGDFANNDVDIWTTIGTLFRNAFVQALRGGFENETPRR